MIYKSFLRRKNSKIYLCLFIIFSLSLSFLIITRTYLTNKGLEAYKDSYILFSKNENIDLSNIKDISEYNKAIHVECNSSLSEVYITKNKPIYYDKTKGRTKKCSINNIEFNYTPLSSVNIIQNEKLYNTLVNTQSDYYYFIKLNNWFKANQISKELSIKYNVDVSIQNNKIDDIDYKNYINLFNIFIKIIFLLFVILFLTSIINIIIDERRNNKLYHMLGYSKLKIISMTTNKIILIIILPLTFLTMILIINNYIFK